jgi:hypothetical protein
MGRPAGYQWQPLGYDTDPVPGDPGQVSQEAQHLAAVADQITSQVAVLRRIAGDDTEVGKHAEVIRSQASDLAVQMDKIVGRYQKVSSILNSWVPDLEQAQSMSIQALDEAEGPYQKLNQTVALPSGNNLTAQQKQDVQNYHNAMQQAQGQLNDAIALLGRAIALRDSSGSYHANLINEACNDGMRDHHSLFGDIAGFFTSEFSWVAHHWSQIVADVCTVLEVVATILAIAAFILAQFVPGLDVLVDALVLTGMIATGAALGGRIALAVTGHGSWLDVGIDAFALATFGLGRLAGVAARAMVPGVEAASKSAYLSELLTDIATDGPRSAMIAKFADQEGVSSVEMAYRLAEHAPALANGAKLAGFTNVMMSIGGFGEEGSTAAKLLSLGDRFTTPISDLSRYATISKALTTVTGLSAGTAGVTGIAASTMNGLELDWGSWKGTLEIPSLHNWYYSHLERPTGAPAGG